MYDIILIRWERFTVFFGGGERVFTSGSRGGSKTYSCAWREVAKNNIGDKSHPVLAIKPRCACTGIAVLCVCVFLTRISALPLLFGSNIVFLWILISGFC